MTSGLPSGRELLGCASALALVLLLVGYVIGVFSQRACSAGWRVQSPITRSK